MVRLKIGDVFEIVTPIGKAYIQYVLNNETIGELIRVIPGVYDNQPINLAEIVDKKEEYFVHFPIKAANKQKIIELIGNFELPYELDIPKQFRTLKKDRDGNLIGWQIVDYDTWQRETVNKLSDQQQKLSPWGTWNDTLLIERISQGWSLDKWV
jgi:hypothetical protein